MRKLGLSNFIEVLCDIFRPFSALLHSDRLPAWGSVRNRIGENIKKVSFFLPQGQKSYQMVYWKAEVRKQCIIMYSFIIYRGNFHYFFTFRFMTPNIPGTFCPYRTVSTMPGGLFCTSRNSEHVQHLNTTENSCVFVYETMPLSTSIFRLNDHILYSLETTVVKV